MIRRLSVSVLALILIGATSACAELDREQWFDRLTKTGRPSVDVLVAVNGPPNWKTDLWTFINSIDNAPTPTQFGPYTAHSIRDAISYEMWSRAVDSPGTSAEVRRQIGTYSPDWIDRIDSRKVTVLAYDAFIQYAAHSEPSWNATRNNVDLFLVDESKGPNNQVWFSCWLSGKPWDPEKFNYSAVTSSSRQ